MLPSLLPNKPSRTKGNSDPRSKPRKLNEMPSLSIAKVGSSDRSLDPPLLERSQSGKRLIPPLPNWKEAKAVAALTEMSGRWPRWIAAKALATSIARSWGLSRM